MFRPFLRQLKALNNKSSSIPRYASSNSTSTSSSRIDRILTRLPPFLHPYTLSLRHAPVSNITAFLILHELTAVVPLVGLATTFHYTNWLPESWTEARYVREGVERFGRYFGRKGWFGFGAQEPGGNALEQNVGERVNAQVDGVGAVELEEQVEGKWGVSQASGRILVEVATAYAITKVFLPVRIVLSVWATPWFARVVVGRIGGGMGRVLGRGSSQGITATKTGKISSHTAASTRTPGADVAGKTANKGLP